MILSSYSVSIKVNRTAVICANESALKNMTFRVVNYPLNNEKVALSKVRRINYKFSNFRMPAAA